MKVTNRQGLPEAFVRAVTAKPYEKKGDVSVTALINPLQITILQERHADEIEEGMREAKKRMKEDRKNQKNIQKVLKESEERRRQKIIKALS